jgi:polyhydroxyalkanoate synthesis regulator phasin
LTDSTPKPKGWLEIERAVEEAVKKALSKVKVPRREELQSLHARLDDLSKRVDALTKSH